MRKRFRIMYSIVFDLNKVVDLNHNVDRDARPPECFFLTSSIMRLNFENVKIG